MGQNTVIVAARPGILRAAARSIRSRGGRSWRALRHVIERLLHPLRRSRAHRRVERLGPPRRIVVVCLGNICRSPYLEAVLRRDLPGTVVESAGFIGPGRPVPGYSSVAANRRGLDMSAHRSRVITTAIANSASLLIVMDARQARRLRRDLHVPAARIVVAGDLDPFRINQRTIQDPFRQPLDVFEFCFDRLDRVGRALVASIHRAP